MLSPVIALLLAVGQHAASPMEADSMGFREVASWPFGPAHAIAEDTVNNRIFLASGAGVMILRPEESGEFTLISDAIRTHGGNINVLIFDYARQMLFMGGDNAWLEIWSVPNNSTPTRITSYQDTVSYAFSDAYIMDMLLEGNHLLVGYENVYGSAHYVKVFDISNLPSLQEITRISLSFPINNFSKDGNRLFVNTNGSTFVFDISDISAPDSIGYLPVGNCFGIAEDTVFYAVWGSWNGIYGIDIYNISDLSNPVLIGQNNVSLARTYHKVRKYGNRIYACGELLDVWDVSDLTDPVVVWSFWPMSDGIFDFSPENGLLLTASGYAGMSSIAFDSLGNPFEAEFFRTPGINKGITTGNGYAFYITRIKGGLRLDILRYDQHQGDLNFNILASSEFSMAYYGENLYITSDSFLTRIDVSDPANPFVANRLRLPRAISTKRALAIGNGYAFVGSDSGFYVVSLDSMQVVSSLADTAFSYGWNLLYVHGNYLYIVSRYQKIGAVDISNPSSPRLLSLSYFPQLYGVIRSITFYDHYAYMSTDVSQIAIFDISDPVNPTYLGDVPPNDRNYGLRELSVHGNYMFGTRGSYTAMVAYDLSDPTAPEIAGYYGNYYEYTNYSIDGDDIYLSDWTIGVHILHFTPTSISEGADMPALSSVRVLSDELAFQMPRSGKLQLRIYNASGRIVRNVNGWFDSGSHSVSLNGLRNGVYFYVMQTETSKSTGRFILIK